MKTALVLEGGAFRTIFSSGVCDAFLDGGLPLPDYTLGVSAGISYGVSYLSRQSRRNLRVLTTYVRDRRYMGMGNYLRRGNRSYFGLRFSYETIPNELERFDYDAFAAYPGQAEAVVTNLETGQADYLPVPRHDEHNLLLQATCAIPFLFPVYHINGQPYLDGGCADAIPWKHAFDSDPGAQLRKDAGPHHAHPAAGLPEVPPLRGNAGNPGSAVQPVPCGALRSGAGGPGAGHRPGGHHRLFPDRAGSGEDPCSVAVRLLCRAAIPARRGGILVRQKFVNFA